MKKTLTKFAIAGITCSAIVIECLICQHFGIMPVYWITTPILAFVGAGLMTEQED